MSQSLTINDREYIPAGEVGKHFGYTRDYILTLTRDQKIDGRKIGHRWYVNLESAKNFFDSAKVEREVRRQEVSEVRKAELRAHTVEYAVTVPHRNAALLETFAILVLGLFVGVTGYVGASAPQQATLSGIEVPSLRELALSFYDFFSPPKTSIEIERAVGTADESTEVGDHEDEVSEPVSKSLVVGSDQALTETNLESIRESFSDDVSVSMDPHNPDSGLIIPHFKNKDGETYRFLLVPIVPEDNS